MQTADQTSDGSDDSLHTRGLHDNRHFGTVTLDQFRVIRAGGVKEERLAPFEQTIRDGKDGAAADVYIQYRDVSNFADFKCRFDGRARPEDRGTIVLERERQIHRDEDLVLHYQNVTIIEHGRLGMPTSHVGAFAFLVPPVGASLPVRMVNT